VAERSNARLKDEFGGNQVMVKGASKVMSHPMFGVRALSADPLMRLRRCRHRNSLQTSMHPRVQDSLNGRT